ncbi:hypothetical protein [Streptacidiphilus cavernicola]|uniref:Uncharacterized protein n=1 Tax=Streptacidiphilus cavernicola TaxID=3342716 RepID=A0ABV6VRE6_9ACTN
MTRLSAKDQAAEHLRAYAARTRTVNQLADVDLPAALSEISHRVRQLRARRAQAAGQHRNATRARLDEAARNTLATPGALTVLIRFVDEQELPGRRPLRSVAPGPDPDLQIEGALLFGCLLHLSTHPISAVFWWKIAAGAGNQTAAICLYLQHVLRGENREAFWWLNQAIAVERATHPATAMPPSLPEIDIWPEILPRLLPAHRPTATTPILRADFTPALDRLVVRPDPNPDPYDLDLDIDVDIDGIAGRPGPSFGPSLEALT